LDVCIGKVYILNVFLLFCDSEVWWFRVMPEFKVVVSDPTTGRAKTYVVKGDAAYRLIGLKIGDIIDGSVISDELKGKKLQIRGGSDSSGFPMRPDIPGGVKKRVLLSGPPGFHPREKGERRRKMVRGNTITEDIVQINVKILTEEELKKLEK